MTAIVIDIVIAFAAISLFLLLLSLFILCVLLLFMSAGVTA